LQISLLGQKAGNGREEDWKLSRRRMDGRKVRTVKDKERGAGKDEGRQGVLPLPDPSFTT